MKRIAAKVVGVRKIEIMEEPMPKPQAGQLLLKILACGLCHSDMPGFWGQSTIAEGPNGNYMEKNLKYPFEIGHEPVGIVEEVGPGVTGFKPGDVVGGGAMGCFANYAIVNANMMVIVPPSIKEPKYCLPEPIGCCVNIVRVANPKFGETAAVIGCGMMGLITIAGLAKSGAREVIAIDFMDSRLEVAKKMGATTVLNPKKVDMDAEIKRLTDGKGVDVVVEITGRLAALTLACKIIKGCRGNILIPSLYAGDQVLEAQCGYDLMFKSPIVHSTHPWYSFDVPGDYKMAVWGYEKGILPFRQLITHEFKLTDIMKAMDYVETGKEGYIKGIVCP